MNKQKFFNFDLKKYDNEINFYINSTNNNAYNGVVNIKNKYLYLSGPRKSGKTFLGNLWLKKYNSIKYEDNFDLIINNYKNVLIDDFSNEKDEEKLFHIINHCYFNNLSILIVSNFKQNEIKLNINDLLSRIKMFLSYEIFKPDDDMLLNILTKSFIERQFIINKHEIFEYILKRANRSYEDMFKIVEKIDALSLEKKRQLTIPLIKEIL